MTTTKPAKPKHTGKPKRTRAEAVTIPLHIIDNDLRWAVRDYWRNRPGTEKH